MAHPASRWFALALVGAALSVPTPALAASRGESPAVKVLVQRAMISQEAAKRVFDQLQLTQGQRKQCMEIVRKGYLANRDLRGRAKTSWHALMVLLRSPAATYQQALDRQREVGRLQEILAERRLATWFSVRKLLTPVQLSRLSSITLDPAGFGEANGEQGNSRPDAKR